MADPRDFTFFVEADRIKVRHVSARTLGSGPDGHPTGGDYRDSTIRIFRGEYRSAARAYLLHELGHHLVARQEINPQHTTEEEICDVLTWLPFIFSDPRNAALLSYLGLRYTRPA